MATLIGPSHHFFYGALCRRFLLFDHLADAFAPLSASSWASAKQQLDASYKRTFRRLIADEGLGIAKPLPLQRVLDDTPIESFLIDLSDDLDAYQSHLLELMGRSASRPGWLEELERVAMLWGRQLAQECLAAPNHGALARGPQSVRGVYEAIYNIIQGGNFIWQPFLIRRYTDFEIQYELRTCPHRRPAANASRHGSETVDLSCRVESLVIRGFAEALLSNVNFGRQSRETYCLDELRLQQL